MIDLNPSRFVYYLNKIPILKSFSEALYYLHNGFKIHSSLKKVNQINKIDFVEYTEGGDFWNSLFKKFKYTTHLHGSPYTFKKQQGKSVTRADYFRRKLEHRFINRASVIFSPSRAMLNIVENEMGQTLKNAFVVPYPIKIMEKENSKPNNNREKVNIFFASRNDPVKGGDIFISVLKSLPGIIQDKITVNIYGFEPSAYLNELDFINLNHFVPKEVLDVAYKEADICVIPSLFDNSPNTVYEAMAKRKVLVASKVGGIPEIIGNNRNGFLFNPGNLQDFKKKLTDAISLVEKGKHKNLTKNAQNRIRKISNMNNDVKRRLAIMKICN
tara:strand:+ start:4632 stop:5615 length:984 start_codon:yes stop_codon:yes gene_type:complete